MAGETFPFQPEQLLSPVEREICARHTVGNYSALLVSLGSGVEARYLGEEFLHDSKSVGLFTLSGVTEAVQNYLPHDPVAVDFTPDKVRQTKAESVEIIEGWGATIIARAEKLGVAEEHPLFEESPAWGIFTPPTPEGEDADPSPVLFARMMPDAQGRGGKKLVYLDTLHALDPDFLPDQLRRIHSAMSAASLADNVEQNFKSHAPESAAILPDFMLRLRETPAAQQETVVRGIVELAAWLLQIGGEAGDRMKKMLTGLVSLHALQDIGHRGTCLIVPPEEQLQHLMQLTLAKSLHPANHNPSSVEPTIPYNRFLIAPHKYMPRYLKAVQAMHQADLAAAIDMEDVRELIAALDQVEIDRAAGKYYREEMGVAEQDMDWLSQMDTGKDTDGVLFTTMFFTLLIERQKWPGSTQAPAFRAFLRSYLGAPEGPLTELRQHMFDQPLPAPPQPHSPEL